MSHADPRATHADPEPLGLGGALVTALWSALLTGVLAGLVDGGLVWSHFRALPETAVEATRIDRWSDLGGGASAATARRRPAHYRPRCALQPVSVGSILFYSPAEFY